MKHWIFDLDGTLIDSFGSYTGVLTKVLGEFGVTFPEADHAQARHHVLPELLKRYLEPDKVASAFEKVCDLNIERQHEIKPFPGILQILDLLQDRDNQISLFTARELRTAAAILEHTGLNRYFKHVVTRDCVPRTKPHPDGIHRILDASGSSIEEMVMIGDHRMDIEAARSAGVKSISVCWDEVDLSLDGLADHHFTDVNQLHAWASQIYRR